MINYGNIITKKKQEIFSILLLVFVLSIPFSGPLSARLLIIALLVSFLIGSKNSLNNILSQAWTIILYFTIIIIGLLYSTDIYSGLKVLETNFSLLVIPIVFSQISSIDEKTLVRYLSFFTAGLLVVCFICLLNAFMLYHENGDTKVFFFYELTAVINVQPTYLAYYLIFAITFALYLLYYGKDKINRLVVISVLVLFFLVLMLTGGQTAFISMLFVFSFFVLKFLVEKRSLIRTITFGLVSIMMICMFLISSIDDGSRNSILNDSWERFVLWEAAIKANPNIVFGVGTGDYKEVLNKYYLTHGMNQFANDSYNSHNQFIQILFANGLLGLLSVIILICRPIYLAVKNYDILGVLVFFPFIIYGLTEVFLGRYQGVVFFALLHQVFISYYSSLKPLVTPLKGV